MRDRITVSTGMISKMAEYIGNTLIGGKKPSPFVLNGIQGNWIGVSGWRDVTRTGFEVWVFHVDSSAEINEPADFAYALTVKVLLVSGVASAHGEYIRRDIVSRKPTIRLEVIWLVERPLSVYLGGIKDGH